MRAAATRGRAAGEPDRSSRGSRAPPPPRGDRPRGSPASARRLGRRRPRDRPCAHAARALRPPGHACACRSTSRDRRPHARDVGPSGARRHGRHRAGLRGCLGWRTTRPRPRESPPPAGRALAAPRCRRPAGARRSRDRQAREEPPQRPPARGRRARVRSGSPGGSAPLREAHRGPCPRHPIARHGPAQATPDPVRRWPPPAPPGRTPRATSTPPRRVRRCPAAASCRRRAWRGRRASRGRRGYVHTWNPPPPRQSNAREAPVASCPSTTRRSRGMHSAST